MERLLTRDQSETSDLIERYLKTDRPGRVVIDLNAEVEGYGDDFDYRDKLRDSGMGMGALRTRPEFIHGAREKQSTELRELFLPNHNLT
jgi:hypothetical protein